MDDGRQMHYRFYNYLQTVVPYSSTKITNNSDANTDELELVKKVGSLKKR